MPFHVAAFSKAANSTPLVALTPIADTVLRVSGNYFYVPRQAPNLAGAYALGADITQARILTPSLNNLAYPNIAPCDFLAEPNTRPAIQSLFRKPWSLVPSESISVEGADAAANTRVSSLLWFSDGPIAPIEGDIIRTRWTAAITCVAYTWVAGAITPDSVLPAGRYQCVGARVQSATGIGFRFVPVNSGGSWRPGGIAFDAISDVEPPEFRDGGLGVWFEFENDTPPTLEMLAVTTDSTQTVWLDLIYLGPTA